MQTETIKPLSWYNYETPKIHILWYGNVQPMGRYKTAEEAKKAEVDALLGGIGNTDGKADGGEGDDNQAGDKGKSTGDPNASGYYGNSGTGSGGNYRLGNRKAVIMPKPDYDCNEEGGVFVEISVDNSGSVVKATPGVKGTTNSAACLLQRANTCT